MNLILDKVIANNIIDTAAMEIVVVNNVQPLVQGDNTAGGSGAAVADNMLRQGSNAGGMADNVLLLEGRARRAAVSAAGEVGPSC